MSELIQIASAFERAERAVVYPGDCREMLREMPPESVRLIVTSPPYNLGKEYERKLSLKDYVANQTAVIKDCVRILKHSGSICWQVGNFVDKGSIVPIDSLLFPEFHALGLKLRNRIIWHFEHGLHCSRRFSGRYETILWFTKSDDYVFDLDSIRIPQKYPGKKYFKGPKAGQYSCNPLGKNPGDLWAIPNVKSNHVEKTSHPCQFPIELIERLVLALTKKDDWIFDPFLGTGTTVIAALRHGRRAAGAEILPKYVQIARERINRAAKGDLPVRPMMRPVFDPKDAGKNLTTAPWLNAETNNQQPVLLEKQVPYRTKNENYPKVFTSEWFGIFTRSSQETLDRNPRCYRKRRWREMQN
jgi:adenine-specific DNA-methyltransferase